MKYGTVLPPLNPLRVKHVHAEAALRSSVGPLRAILLKLTAARSGDAIISGVYFHSSNAFSVGCAGSYTEGKIHADLGKDDISGAAGLVYVRRAISPDFIGFAAVAYSSQHNRLYRPTVNGHVTGTTRSSAWTGNLAVQHRGWMFCGFSIAPRGNLTYSYSQVKGFSEKGAIDALHNDGYNTNLFTGEIGFWRCWPTDFYAVI